MLACHPRPVWQIPGMLLEAWISKYNLSLSLLRALTVARYFLTRKADRAGRLPALMLDEFNKHGHTYTQFVGGQFVVLTREPENVKAICQGQFRGTFTWRHPLSWSGGPEI